MPTELDILLAKTWEREEAKCREDAAYYIFNHVNTRDERDRKNPVKPFPDKKYIRFQLQQWIEGEPVQFVVKSRQLTISWLAVAYISWIARFHPHQFILFRSKKEDDAVKMVFQGSTNVARLSFIETHLAPFLRQEINWTHGQAVYPNGSIVEAVPQGPAHVESRVLTLCVDDEASLQEFWKAGFAAALPCSDRYIGISTVRMPSDFSEEVRIGADDKEPVDRGMWTSRSASNVQTTWLHYSADPAKDPQRDGLEWFENFTRTYPGGTEGHHWQQHMEMNFDVIAGTRLFPEFEKYAHLVTCDPIPKDHQIGWRYDAGFDYGKRNKTVFGVYAIDPDGNRYVVSEVAATGEQLGGVVGIAKVMKDNPYWGSVRSRIYADPSLWNRNQTLPTGGYTSIADLFREQGVYLTPAPVKGQAADDIAIERLKHFYWEDMEAPRLRIFRTCTMHIEQWKKLRWKEWSPGQQENHSLREELVDRDNDSWDAYKYSECARPKPEQFRMTAPVGSVEYIRQKILRESTRTSRVGQFVA